MRSELVEKRAEATSEAQDIVAFTAALFADCNVEPFFNKLLDGQRLGAQAARLGLPRQVHAGPGASP
jgi:hypothetical protein